MQFHVCNNQVPNHSYSVKVCWSDFSSPKFYFQKRHWIFYFFWFFTSVAKHFWCWDETKTNSMNKLMVILKKIYLLTYLQMYTFIIISNCKHRCHISVSFAHSVWTAYMSVNKNSIAQQFKGKLLTCIYTHCFIKSGPLALSK